MLYFYSSNNNLQIHLPKLNLTACVGVGGKEVTEKATPPRHVAEMGRRPPASSPSLPVTGWAPGIRGRGSMWLWEFHGKQRLRSVDRQAGALAESRTGIQETRLLSPTTPTSALPPWALSPRVQWGICPGGLYSYHIWPHGKAIGQN